MATGRLICCIAVALPNIITRKRPPLCGLVLTGYPESGGPSPAPSVQALVVFADFVKRLNQDNHLDDKSRQRTFLNQQADVMPRRGCVIGYQHGRITILDRVGLENAASCEYHEAMVTWSFGV